MGNRILDPVERFWSHVEKTDACWHWTASVTGRGYGNYKLDGRTQGVHRIAYELLVGPIPEGLTIDHLCRVKTCVNPAHLEPVTNRENIQRARGGIESCINGHPYTPETMIPRKDGSTYKCRVCHNARRRKGYVRPEVVIPTLLNKMGQA